LGVAYAVVPIAECPPSVDEFKACLHTHGFSVRQLFNTAGRRYRETEMKKRLPGLSEHEAVALLSSDGMLVKRPILLGNDLALVGFKEALWTAAFNKRQA